MLYCNGGMHACLSRLVRLHCLRLLRSRDISRLGPTHLQLKFTHKTDDLGIEFLDIFLYKGRRFRSSGIFDVKTHFKPVMAKRDNFTMATIGNLCKRVGGKCSICCVETLGPNSDPYSYTSIGEAAHISAASEHGPRYDADMPIEERKSFRNGIWLCSNCHKKVKGNDCMTWKTHS